MIGPLHPRALPPRRASWRAPRQGDASSSGARRGGFTLIEVLIALSIAALVALMGYRALQSLADSEARLGAEAQRWRELDQFFSRIEGDLRQAVPRTVRVGGAREPAWIGGLGSSGDAELVFSRAGPEFEVEPGSGGQRIYYRLRNGQIEVAYWPGYDRPADIKPTAYPLVGNVTAFRLRYLSDRGTWLAQWPATKDDVLPRAVQVDLVLASGERIERWLALR